ncbi:hypothetical protein SADUNF_Sadunf14G0041800 [Salix dunnii]|uniref:Uncharacterized protein n=1 Tax=Salix dunnii TaxID=1413687 RepID=A0A835JHK3_9ROSI|nr:hypothetical protein SADUNF_Sadunf14G0041800 [Salix dunnii]
MPHVKYHDEKHIHKFWLNIVDSKFTYDYIHWTSAEYRFKLDFHKAFDSILWEYINEGLSCRLQRGCDLGLIEDINIGHDHGFMLSHLQFVDDTLIFSSTFLYSMQNIKRILVCFELMSGLKVNIFKSNITGVGIKDIIFYYTAKALRCKRGDLPFIYLGVPIGARSCRTSMWKPIFRSIRFRLALWKGMLLSNGGSSHKRNCDPSLWTGKEEDKKLCSAKWSTFTFSRSASGLRIGSLRDKSITLLFKWLWRLGSEESTMWNNMIKIIYNPKCFRLILQDTISGDGNTRLKNIANHQSIMFVGNGKRIKFWLDNGSLEDQFPALFILSNDKEASLHKMGVWDGYQWFWYFSWSRSLRGGNIGLLDHMYAILSKLVSLILLMGFFGLVSWSICLLFNDMIFKHKTLNYDTLSIKISRWTNLKKLGLIFLWSPSTANSFKWNADGSSLGKPGPSSIGGVLLNHYRIILGIFLISIGILEYNVVKLRAIVEVIEISASNPFLHLMSLVGRVIHIKNLCCTISFPLQPRDWLYASTHSFSFILAMNLIIWQITWLSKECAEQVNLLHGFECKGLGDYTEDDIYLHEATVT